MPLSEFEIIRQIFQQQKVDRNDVLLGIGDDAAVTKVPEGHELALAMDTLIGGVHFPENMKPADIGYRSLAVNLSDLAAMGAEPAWVTLALTIPESNESWLRAFASGLMSLAAQYNLQLIGGDMTRGALSITVQVHGFLPTKQILVRSGAHPGDSIYITGTLGDAAAGLASWQQTDKSFAWLKQRFTRPVPRIEAGFALRGIATSVIDVSDGLIADLGHILESSNVGAKLKMANLPLSLAICEKFDLEQAREMALSGGDDYELCFTAPSNKQEQISKLVKVCQFVEIGVIEAEPGLRCLLPDGAQYDSVGSGFQHF